MSVFGRCYPKKSQTALRLISRRRTKHANADCFPNGGIGIRQNYLGPDIYRCRMLHRGDRPTIPASEQKASSGFLVYTLGLLLAVILTVTSFWWQTPQ